MSKLYKKRGGKILNQWVKEEMPLDKIFTNFRSPNAMRKALDSIGEAVAEEEFEIDCYANGYCECNILNCKERFNQEEHDSNDLWEHRYSHIEELRKWNEENGR